jgi:hypothetical protein
MESSRNIPDSEWKHHGIRSETYKIPNGFCQILNGIQQKHTRFRMETSWNPFRNIQDSKRILPDSEWNPAETYQIPNGNISETYLILNGIIRILNGMNPAETYHIPNGNIMESVQKYTRFQTDSARF